MKTGSIICTSIFILGILLFLVQMWFAPLSAGLFFKLMITLSAIFIIALVITLVLREYHSDKELKDKGFID